MNPPANLEPYVRLLGQALAIEFFLAFGGAELYLARDPKSRNRLAGVIGRDNAAALAAIDTLPRRVPLAKRWIAAVWKAEGLPTAEIARRLHASDVAVRGWLRAAGDDRQLPLL